MKSGKEEYNNKLAQFQLHTRKGIEHTKKQFLEFAKKFPHKYMNGIQNEDSTGDYLYNTKNCYECFDVNQGRDCKFVYNSRNTKNVYDMTVFGALKGVEFCYENHEIGESIRNTCFSDQIWTGASNIYYSKLCSGGCNDLFGCVGLRKSSYCILNKQYTKEEYGKLVPKIIEHMQQTGEWGEFPPASLSPFGYNETVAQEYFPLTKVEILKQEFNWSDFEAPKPSAKKIIKANEIPDEIKNISDDILENALECEVTGKLFRIVQQELQFYRKQNLPLPSKHHDQRHKERMALRNKRKLYNRSCKKCEITIQTTYATDRPEAIFCEKCYLENVN